MAKRRNKSAGKPQDMTPRERLFEASGKLSEAEGLRQAGDFKRARRICEELLKSYPDYVGALHSLGHIFMDLGDHEKAFGCLSKANALSPGNWQLLTALGRAKLKLDMAQSALSDLEAALALAPDNATVLDTLGTALRYAGALVRAADIYRRLMELDPAAAAPKAMLAHCYALMDRGEEAFALTERLVKGGHQISLPLLTLLSYRPDEALSQEARALFDALEASDGDQSSKFSFAKAIAFDRKGQHGEAWEHLLKAHAEKKAVAAKIWQADAGDRNHALERARNTALFKAEAARPQKLPLSLFILGATRSGKSSLEKLVCALPGTKRGFENLIVKDALRRTLQTSRCISGIAQKDLTLEDLPEELEADFRNAYGQVLDAQADGAKVFTNTAPLVVAEALRLRRIIPGCRFVFVKRDLDDQLLRIFMSEYAAPEHACAHTFDPRTIKEHLEWYNAVADICTEKMPDECKIIAYQDMVEDPSATLRLVADLCGLEGEPDGPLSVGDDRGVGAPYHDLIQKALQ